MIFLIEILMHFIHYVLQESYDMEQKDQFILHYFRSWTGANHLQKWLKEKDE